MSANFDVFLKNSLGFDRFFQELSQSPKISNFPPYNVIVREGEKPGSVTGYLIEMAVAGFKKSDINVQLSKNDGVKELSIQGIRDTEENPPKIKYLTNGIANRSFVRRFSLADNVKVAKDGVELLDGILSISLEVVDSSAEKEVLKIK